MYDRNPKNRKQAGVLKLPAENGGMKMATLYIVRHGETEWNKRRKVQGHADIPLNEYGKYLAEETAKGLKNIRFDCAYTSPLKRAKQTAQIILGEQAAPLYEDNRIKEMGFGEYEGMCCAGEDKDEKSGEFQKFFNDTAHFIPAKNAETIMQVNKRTRNFLIEMCTRKDLEGKNILVSTHGAAMTSLLNHIRNNTEPADFWKYKVPPNCAVTIVEIVNGIPKILKENIPYRA